MLYIRHEDIKVVELSRVSQTNSTRMFDLKINYKNHSQMFSGIERDELEGLTNYFNSKKINVTKVVEEIPAHLNYSSEEESGSGEKEKGDDYNSEEDEDF